MDSFGDILVVSSDMEMRRSILTTLERLGMHPICASTVGQCREILARRKIALVFCDRRFTDGNYQDLMDAVLSGPRKAKARVVLTANFITPGEYQRAKRMGIFDVIAAPGNSIAVEWMVILAQRDHLRRGEQASLPSSANPSGLRKIAAAAAKV